MISAAEPLSQGVLSALLLPQVSGMRIFSLCFAAVMDRVMCWGGALEMCDPSLLL